MNEENRGGRPKMGVERRSFIVKLALTASEYAGLIKAALPGEKPGKTARRRLFEDDDGED